MYHIMINFQQKRVWTNTMRSKPVLIFFGILILIFAWNILGFWGKMEETGRNKKIAEDKVAALKQQKEKFFRENFGLAKEGEGVIVVVEDKNPPIVPKTDSSSGVFSFFANWLKWS